MATRYMSSFAFGENEKVRVDKEKGIIYDVAVVTAGEAKGHGVQLDEEFIDTVIAQGNSLKSGAKSRFGHPSMSSTALGTFLGRAKNFRKDGKIARADLFLSKEAENAPGGDLYNYVLSMADNNPDMFGLSIVFKPGKEYVRDADGNKDYDIYDIDPMGFKHFKKDKVEDMPFIECKQFTAVDVVDDPAANPDGLFSSQFNSDTIAGQVSEFLDTHPQVWEVLSQRPEIIDGFMAKYTEYRSRLTDSHISESDSDELATVTASVDAKPIGVKPMIEKEVIQKINDEFGADILAQVMLNDGDYDMAAELAAKKDHDEIIEQLAAALETNEMLEAQVAELTERLDALSSGEEDAVEFDEAPESLESKPVDVMAEIAARKAEGMSAVDAQDAVAKEYPEEFKAYCQGA